MEAGDKRVGLPIEAIVQIMEDTFSRGGGYVLTVTGTSMSPTLQPGRDRVWLKSVLERPFRKGDIVFARRQNGGFLLHRVIGLRPNGGCTVNGDGQVWTEDIFPGDVLAVAEAICRKEKWIPCSNRGYRLYVRCWALTRPFRKMLVRWKKKLTRFGRKHL